MWSGPYICGIDAALDVVSGKWKGLVLWELHAHGIRRFAELRRALPGSARRCSPSISASWRKTVSCTARSTRKCHRRSNALAVALAPPASRGRHLAAFQYAFTVPGVVAPAVVALFSAGVWVPWLVIAVCAGLGGVALRRLGTHLPAEALSEASVPAR